MTQTSHPPVFTALSPASAVFLVNHGIVTTGSTLQVATVAAVLLERAAHQQWITHGFSTPPSTSEPQPMRGGS